MKPLRNATFAALLCAFAVLPSGTVFAQEPFDEDETTGLIVDGGCAYYTTDVTATVTSSDGSNVTLADSEGNTFRARLADFSGTPEPGARFAFSKRYIVSGTCAPFVYTLTGPAAG